ncbi:MAG: homospermidine synthase, partial [Rhizobiales bacterium]|nr:homospermidine synthase [Hyphomicrobiales bacterium]
MSDWPIHGRISGPVVMIGFGSIGRGTLPLLERHFEFDKSRLSVIDPDPLNKWILDERGIPLIQQHVTKENYVELLTPLLTKGEGQGFCVNLSVDTSSVAIMELCRSLGVLYIDTVNEPWLGFYFDKNRGPAERSNYALRGMTLDARRRNPGGTTAVSTCGANPGMVSFLVKQATLNLARDLNLNVPAPKTRDEWASLMRHAGVKGIHIAERDTQRTRAPKPPNVFLNTWSVEGFISEGLQPSELGWGTHEKWLPETAQHFDDPDAAAIYLMRPGADTRVRTWCPTLGPQYGFLITHNESISIADYFTVFEDGKPVYRPTCHYAYHPADDAVLSWHELFGSGKTQDKLHVLDEDELVDGIDELGVLLYGHGKNAYWFGSQLSLEETRKLAPHQSATGLQVTSAILAGMVWALENPNAGIVEAD